MTKPLINVTFAVLMSGITLLSPIADCHANSAYAQSNMSSAWTEIVNDLDKMGWAGLYSGTGAPLFLGDFIVNEDAEKLSIDLLDGTQLTLEPHSQLLIDTFVYDRGASTRESQLNQVKASLRFTTGKILESKSWLLSKSLAIGTMAVRG